jgi:hypothetical protein
VWAYGRMGGVGVGVAARRQDRIGTLGRYVGSR